MKHTGSDHPVELTLEQKRTFYRDGFIVLKNIVPKELTHRAPTTGQYHRRSNCEWYDGRAQKKKPLCRQRRHHHRSHQQNGAHRIAHQHHGAHLILRQMALRRFCIRASLPEKLASTVCRTMKCPIMHFFRIWTASGQAPFPKGRDEVDDWYAPKTPHFGDRSASVIGINGSPLFQDPDCMLSIGSFTTFVGVVLSDQSKFGYGNFAVLRGAHHHTAKFFRRQRAQGGVIGPEGHDWPRLKPVGDKGVGINYMPEWIANHYREDAQYTPDGLMWPEPTPLLVEEGDAFITAHGIPHCGTRNDLGADPRISAYFRLRRHRPGGAKVRGDSDHPDRGWGR